MLHHTSQEPYSLQESYSSQESYIINGYAIYNGIIEDKLLDEVLKETKEVKDDAQLDCWKNQEVTAVFDLAYHPKVLSILKELYNEDPFPFQTLNFDQSPAIGIHCDTIHFNTEPACWMCGVWIALEDATMENGPLQYFPGSHDLPVIRFQDIGLTPDRNKETLMHNLGIYSAWLHRRNDTMGLKPTTLLCKRGTVLIWHANLMHMSMDPKPGTTRASQVTHYYFKKEGIKYTVPAFDMEKTDTFALERKRFAVSKDGPI